MTSASSRPNRHEQAARRSGQGHIYCVSAVSVDRVFKIDHLPQWDEKIFAADMEEQAGGQGLWTARALASWRAPVTFVTCVGDDAAGRWLAAEMSSIDGLDVALTALPGKASATCVILVDPSGEKALVLSPSEAALVSGLGKNIAAIPGDVVTANFFHPGLQSVFAQARASRATTILDLERPGLSMWGWDAALRALDEADIVCSNAKTLEWWNEAERVGGDLLARAHAFATRLGERASRVCVTLGRDGVLALDRGETFHLAAETISVRNSTGAGDTFLAGLAFATLRSAPFTDAVRFASAAAAQFLTAGNGQLADVQARYRRLGGDHDFIPWPAVRHEG
jgi:ribokinase